MTTIAAPNSSSKIELLYYIDVLSANLKRIELDLAHANQVQEELQDQSADYLSVESELKQHLQTLIQEKARLITELEIAVASTNDAEYMTDNDVRNQYEDKGEALRKRQEELKKQRLDQAGRYIEYVHNLLDCLNIDEWKHEAHEALLQQKKRRAERQQKEAEEIEALRSEVTRTTEAINRAERSCFALKATLSNLEKALAAAEAKERAHVQQASEISSKRIQEMAGLDAQMVAIKRDITNLKQRIAARKRKAKKATEGLNIK